MSRIRRAPAGGVVAIAALVGLASCEREEREFRQSPPAASAPTVQASPLSPGPSKVLVRTRGPYDGNAYAMSAGKDLFNQFNCSGCHSHGGGGMGPPLMDADWIYGSDPAAVFASIAEGRPNGMPAWSGKLSNDQIWQLVAYVRSMSGIGRKDVRSGRDDHMQGRSSEQNTRLEQRVPPSVAPASEMP